MTQTSTSKPGAAPRLVCFSQLRWGFVFQRPQHLMTRAARDYHVTFWEEPMIRPGEGPRLDRFPQHERLEVITPVLPEGLSGEEETAALRHMLDGVLAEEPARPLGIAWYITPMMLSFSRHLDPTVTVYDNMDELSAFRNASPRLLRLEDDLIRRADVIFTGGVSIYEAKAHRHPNIHPMPSSIDAAHFAHARAWRGAAPGDQADLPHPRIGWFGVIDERTDLDLVAALADLRPDLSFVMIGPVVKIDPATLPQQANVHWLGPKDYRDLPAYLAGWDCGFMPFAINEATRFISPTKTPEYLAAGVPVVSTPIPDVVRPYGTFGLVEIAQTPQEMSAALDRAMQRRTREWLEHVDAFLAGKSWDRTWAEMRALIGKARMAKRGSAKQEAA